MTKDYSQSISINTTPEKAFVALTEEIPNWWGSVNQSASEVGDEFIITFGAAYWTFKITESKINESITWECIDGQPELNHEWIGHILNWSIQHNGETIEILFDQEGLTEALPCFNVCSAAWDRFIITSLKEYLETGKGSPGS